MLAVSTSPSSTLRSFVSGEPRPRAVAAQERSLCALQDGNDRGCRHCLDQGCRGQNEAPWDGESHRKEITKTTGLAAHQRGSSRGIFKR